MKKKRSARVAKSKTSEVDEQNLIKRIQNRMQSAEKKAKNGDYYVTSGYLLAKENVLAGDLIHEMAVMLKAKDASRDSIVSRIVDLEIRANDALGTDGKIAMEALRAAARYCGTLGCEDQPHALAKVITAQMDEDKEALLNLQKEVALAKENLKSDIFRFTDAIGKLAAMFGVEAMATNPDDLVHIIRLRMHEGETITSLRDREIATLKPYLKLPAKAE